MGTSFQYMYVAECNSYDFYFFLQFENVYVSLER